MLIFPEGVQAEGWWKLMDVVHEVVGVKLDPSVWLRGKKKTIEWESFPQVMQHTIVFKCLRCSLSLPYPTQLLDWSTEDISD